MAERLSVIRATPAVVVEWDARVGQSQALLQAAYPHSTWEAVEEGAAASGVPASPGHRTGAAAAAPSGWRARLQRLFQPPAGPAGPATPPPRAWTPDTLPKGRAQLLWSNLGLHTHANPLGVLQQWHAALAVDGFLMFSTFGPDTLKEWRRLWAECGWGPPAQAFRDMHDWGDELVAVGFADPVMDQETMTLTWRDADAAFAELRTMGVNAHPARAPGCRTPRWRERLKGALHERAGPDGRIALSFEVVYGHAFRPAPRARMEPVTAVSLDEMRSLVRTARRTD